jgi:signal transduction histidine kinase
MLPGELARLPHERLLALAAVSEAVNSSLDLRTVLELALDRALEAAGLPAGDIRLLVGHHLELVASRDVSPAFLAAEGQIPLGHCFCGHAARHGRIALIEDLSGLPGLSTSACACERFAAIVSVPIRAGSRTVGVLHAAARDARAFGDEDRVLLEAIGQQIGVAIEKARLHEELKALNRDLEARVAQRTAELAATQDALAEKAEQLRQMLVGERRIEERTRARVAHDLHDGVQQLIIGALFELQAARQMTRSGENASFVGERLAAAQTLLRELETEMRAAIYNLRPVALDAHGLAAALRESAATFQRATGVACAVTVQGQTLRLPQDAELAVFRIVQEALNNVEAHANAQRVMVRLSFEADLVTVEVIDDGRGFNMAGVRDAPRSHLGLIGMKQRAEGIGGSLDIWSGAGQGTHLTLLLPVAQRQESSE